jgi:hypothetical protein
MTEQEFFDIIGQNMAEPADRILCIRVHCNDCPIAQKCKDWPDGTLRIMLTAAYREFTIGKLEDLFS